MSISNCVLAICKQYDTGMLVPCLLDADDIFIEYLKTLSIYNHLETFAGHDIW